MNSQLTTDNGQLKTLILCSVLCLLTSVVGCQKPAQGNSGDADALRRAQLVGNENIQLKKTIADKDAQIADLQKQLEAAHAENDRIAEQHAEIYKGLMQNLLDCSTKLEKYEQETTDSTD